LNAGRGNFSKFLWSPTRHILTHSQLAAEWQRLKAKSPDVAKKKEEEEEGKIT